MAGTSLNDVVLAWGLLNGYDTYNDAKAALTTGMTPEQVAAEATDWNSGLYALASVPPYETGDAILLDPAATGFLLIDSVSGTDKLLIDF